MTRERQRGSCLRATSRIPAVGTAVRRRSSRRRSALVTSVLAVVLLAGCTGGTTSPATADTGSPASTSAAAAASTPVEPAAPPPAEPADAGADGEGVDDGRAGGTPDGGTQGLPGWPTESIPVHGGQFWAAYVAVGVPGDPALQQVLAEVQEVWPGAGLGELGCDGGAAEALGRNATDHAVAVYFPTEQHITEFQRRWSGPYVEAVQVITSCGD
jgi:hypothetical protein